MRAVHLLGGVLMLTTPALADRAHQIDIGGVVGSDSTNSYNTGPCPILLRRPAAPADECVSNPHDGGQGIVIGAHVRYHLLSTLSVEAGLTYAQKGYNSGNEVDLHYLEAPLLVRFDPLANVSPARVFVVGGLSPAVLLTCRESGQIWVTDPAPPHAAMYSGSCAPEPYLDQTPDRFDLSGVVGAGVGWQFSFGAIEVQGLVVRGLVDVDGWDHSGKTVNHATYVVAGFDKKL